MNTVISPIKHLSTEQIDDLYSRYIAGHEKVSDLMVEFGIHAVVPSQLYTLFPPAVHESQCPYCAVPLHSPRPSREVVRRGGHRALAACPVCDHLESTAGGNHNCRCAHCIQRHKQKERDRLLAQRQRIRDEWCPPRQLVGVQELGFSQLVKLGAVLQGLLKQGQDYLAPLSSAGYRLSPAGVFDYEILDSLYRENLVCVDPENSSLEAFVENDTGHRVYLNKACLRLNISTPADSSRPGTPDELAVVVFETLANYDLWPEGVVDDAFGLWHKIAVFETIEFARVNMEAHALPEVNQGKLEEVAQSAVDGGIYSVAELYALTFFAARDVAAKKQRGDFRSLKHFANSYPVFLSNRIKQYSENKWGVTSFHRDDRAPRCALSFVLFENVFGVKLDKGFTTPISWGEVQGLLRGRIRTEEHSNPSRENDVLFRETVVGKIVTVRSKVHSGQKTWVSEEALRRLIDLNHVSLDAEAFTDFFLNFQQKNADPYSALLQGALACFAEEHEARAAFTRAWVLSQSRGAAPLSRELLMRASCCQVLFQDGELVLAGLLDG